MATIKFKGRTIDYDSSPLGTLLERLCDPEILYAKPFYPKRKGQRFDLELGPVWYQNDRYKLQFRIPQVRESIEDRIADRTKEIVQIAPRTNDMIVEIERDMYSGETTVTRRGFNSGRYKKKKFNIENVADLPRLENYLREILP